MDVKDTTTQDELDRYWKIVQAFDSYTELSKGGKGLHVWVEGKVGRGKRRDGVELYSQERFIICTGDTVLNKPIHQQFHLLGILRAELTRGASAEVVLEDKEAEETLSEVVCPAFADEEWTRPAESEFGRLFAGDWQGRQYPSQSEADLALVKMLAQRTESNALCWDAFRLSGLGRREKAARADYMRRTLAMARTHIANDAVSAAHGKAMAEAIFFPRVDIALATPPGSPSQWSATKHFRLLSDIDLAAQPPQRWLVKGIIPDESIGTIYGQSGTFKSFVALDLIAHVANGISWFGRRVHAAPAVYVPFEGQGGIPKRVAAWRQARLQCGWLESKTTTNTRYITDAMNLRVQADRDKLVLTLTERGWAGGVLCIDTLAQAGAGIDENSSEGMGEMIAIFQELQRRLGGVVLVVHHSGKVESAGMRGWSGLRGAMDFCIKCQKEEEGGPFDAQLVLDKVKDDRAGEEVPFSMLSVHLGLDGDGDSIDSLTVIPPQATSSAGESDTPQNSARDDEDDEFIWLWVKQEVENGNYPSLRSLEGQLATMKLKRAITQRRIRYAIGRLMAASRVVRAGGQSPSGNPWLLAAEQPTAAAGL